MNAFLSHDTLVVSLVTWVFLAGGYVVLTRNHLKHLGMDIRRILKGQRKMNRRIARIERRMKNGQ